MAQGYSRQNDGYGESPGVNWGKVGLYGAGAAASYGLIRAGGIKAKNSGHLQNAWGSAGRISGLSRPGGWKAWQQMGATPPKVSAGVRYADGASRVLGAGSAARRMKAAKKARRASSGGAQALQAQLDAFSGPAPGLGAAIATGKQGEAAALKHSWRAQGAAESPGLRSQLAELGASARPFDTANLDRIAGLKPSTAARPRPKAVAATGAVADTWSGMRGYFGAMDYAGLKRAGVAGIRGAGALAAVGLGMKALSYLNPFGD